MFDVDSDSDTGSEASSPTASAAHLATSGPQVALLARIAEHPSVQEGKAVEKKPAQAQSPSRSLYRGSTAASIGSTSSIASVSSGWSVVANSDRTPQGGSRLGKVSASLGSFFRNSMAAVSAPSLPSAPPPGQQLAPPYQRENAVIILDWDDTLIPTTYIQQVILPSLPAIDRDNDEPLRPTSPHYDTLLAHAAIVAQVLKKARSVARVAVVTLATKMWFDASSQKFLPGLDLQGLMEELGIEVFHADRRSSLAKAQALSGNDPSLVAKKTAMSSCLKRMYSGSTTQWNVVSIGDSPVEREALKECLKKDSRNGPPVCKTIKIRTTPTLMQLTAELQNVLPKLHPFVLCETSFDRRADGTNLPAQSGKASMRRTKSMPAR